MAESWTNGQFALDEYYEVNLAICEPGGYQELLRSCLLSKNPKEMITYDNLDKVAVELAYDDKLHKRVKYWKEVGCSWIFEVSSIKPIHLKEVLLDWNHTDASFCIGNVVTEDMKQPEVCFGHAKLFDPEVHTQSKGVNVYYISIEFRTYGRSGTYCKDILFKFNKGPVIRRQVCVDVIEHYDEDMTRLMNAKVYLETLTPNTEPTEGMIVPFKASNPEVDPQEESLEHIYTKKSISTFSITHATIMDANLHTYTYKKKLQDLLTIEEFARQELVSRFNTIVYSKITSQVQIGAESFAHIRYANEKELFIEIPLSRNLSEDTKSGRLVLRSCDSLLIRPFSEVSPDRYRKDKFKVKIMEKTSKAVFAVISKECVERYQLQADTTVCMYVEFVLSRKTFCEWYRAIDLLRCPCLVFPDHKISSYRKSKMSKWSNDWTFDGCQLNDKQKEAVAAIMTPICITLPPILLLGPYGTGKTSTIAQAIKILLTNTDDSKVILCTHSNSAADLYITLFFDYWYNKFGDKRLRPLRLYYSGRTRSTVNYTVQKYCLYDEKTGQFRDPTNDDLEECNLIITTLGTSSCLGSLNFQPSHIIIDEAAQAFECEALTCLALATSTTRIVLAGDQMQLAPEVYSDLSRAQGLGVSILERINNIYEPNHPCRIQLEINYRSNSGIVSLTSELFYSKQIKAGAKPRSIAVYRPVTFVACKGIAVKASESTGYYNQREALEITNRIIKLVENWPKDWGAFDENSICVVSHYAEQVHRIRTELRSRGLHKVSVERVLNVQGKQFAVVFISIVRTRYCTRESVGYKNDFGFLTDEKLMNTAITRARDIVAVVGDPVALTFSGHCKYHWSKYIHKASILEIDPYDYALILLPNRELLEEDDESNLNPSAKEFVPRLQNKIENSDNLLLKALLAIHRVNSLYSTKYNRGSPSIPQSYC